MFRGKGAAVHPRALERLGHMRAGARRARRALAAAAALAPLRGPWHEEVVLHGSTSGDSARRARCPTRRSRGSAASCDRSRSRMTARSRPSCRCRSCAIGGARATVVTAAGDGDAPGHRVHPDRPRRPLGRRGGGRRESRQPDRPLDVGRSRARLAIQGESPHARRRQDRGAPAEERVRRASRDCASSRMPRRSRAMPSTPRLRCERSRWATAWRIRACASRAMRPSASPRRSTAPGDRRARWSRTACGSPTKTRDDGTTESTCCGREERLPPRARSRRRRRGGG